MTKILIINLHSSRNAGDAALASAASQQLHQAFPDSTVTLSMNDPDSHTEGDPKVGSFMYWIHTLSGNCRPKWRMLEIIRLGVGSLAAVISFRWFKRPIFLLLSSDQKSFLQAYFDADLVASAPGNFLYTSGKFGVSFLAAIYSMAYAIWAGKPLYILPQSVGPLKRKSERWLIRYIFNRVRLILVREEASLDQIRQVKVSNPQIYIQPDMAFSFTGAPAEDAIGWLHTNGIEIGRDKPRLGITAIDWGGQTGQHALQAQYESALAEAASYFINSIDGKVIFFPQVVEATASSDDRLPARRVVNSLQDFNNQVTVIEQPTSPAVLKAAYGLMDIFIGTRMHSNIFALSNAVPVLAIAYRPKTHGIMHMLGLDEWVIDIQNVNDTVLTEKLNVLWEHRNIVREQIQRALPSILSQSTRTGSMVAVDYAEYKKNRP